jgi:hypothetical protein
MYNKIKNPDTFMENVPDLLKKQNIYLILKEFIYILSNKKRCKLLVEDDLRSKKLNKEYIKNIIDILGKNLNLIKEFIFLKYTGNNNNWGNKQYESAYKMFKTLLIIEPFYDKPLKLLGIKYSLSKPDKVEKIIENMEIDYVLKTKKNNLNGKDVKSISEFIILMKKSGFNLWFSINFVWNHIYTKWAIDNIQNSNVNGNNNIEYQKSNNLLGIKIYLLCKKGFITSSNIFQNFNI